MHEWREENSVDFVKIQVQLKSFHRLKEKDREKHHGKDHKRKDRRKVKEHKKDKTKEDENLMIPKTGKPTLKRPAKHSRKSHEILHGEWSV